ncbi:hypothetical protein GDO81_026220 [Engystomops pustulosus]|uniref:Uncharacterized protein n=1 Tax=Engystomops pustulosus TaxID=76066 RepID=A0AAV6YH59_ENGPU|nr:hypothetical protein GDO81_026220 [Engystomops pustulosus]
MHPLASRHAPSISQQASPHCGLYSPVFSVAANAFSPFAHGAVLTSLCVPESDKDPVQAHAIRATQPISCALRCTRGGSQYWSTVTDILSLVLKCQIPIDPRTCLLNLYP